MMSVSRAEGFALCHTCQLRHPCFTYQGYLDFAERHRGHSLSYLNRDWLHEQHRSKLAAWDPRKLLVSAFGYWEALKLRTALEGYAGNADVKQALAGSATSVTVTNLNSLASSATAGWQGAEISNTTNLYLDYLVQVILDFANTAPANSKAAFVFAGGGSVTGKLSNPMSGTEGTLTLPDITSNAVVPPRIGTLPYNTADEVVEGSPMSVAAGFGGIMPPFWAPAIMNHSGAALAATGNDVTHRGVFATVV